MKAALELIEMMQGLCLGQPLCEAFLFDQLASLVDDNDLHPEVRHSTFLTVFFVSGGVCCRACEVHMVVLDSCPVYCSVSTPTYEFGCARGFGLGLCQTSTQDLRPWNVASPIVAHAGLGKEQIQRP